MPPPQLGENNPKAKITSDDVKAIRSSSKSRVELSKEYNLVWTTIDDILKRRTWKHI